MPTLDVLISTIPHRHSKLCALLAEFDRQWQPGFGVRVYRDNLELPVLASHMKRQKLTESSLADYVCSVDDDDWIAPDYVATIMAALETGPDYVGFKVQCTRNGEQWRTADHSLSYPGYESVDTWFYRDITHLNPLRRRYAIMVDWAGKIDEEWAAALRETGQVKTQVYIDREMYIYRADTSDCFYTDRGPMPEPLPEIPEYPWLTVLS